MTAPPFGSYAAYYDLLYRDKDYTAEAKFVDGELQRVRPGARTILEFGCSTGVHAEQLIRLGYSVEGVDSSAGMLAAARVRRDAMPRALAARMGLTEARIRDAKLGRQFDAVISLVKGGTKLDQMAEENQTTWPLGRVSENGCAAGFRSVRARLRACPASAPARPHSQPRAKGGVRMVERQRRGGRACCVRDDSCRRSAPGCGRDESADRAARQSAVRSRRSRSIR